MYDHEKCQEYIRIMNKFGDTTDYIDKHPELLDEIIKYHQEILIDLPMVKLDKRAKILSRTHRDDIGLDIHSLEHVIIKANSGLKIRTGIAIALKSGEGGLIWDKSSFGGRWIKVLGGAIDPQYRGELFVCLFNLNNHDFEIKAGDAIAQLIIVDVNLREPTIFPALDMTDRGSKGFGEGSHAKSRTLQQE